MSYPPPPGSDPNRPQDTPRALPTYGRPPESPANPYQQQHRQQPYGQQPPYPQQQQQYEQPQYPPQAPYGYGYPGTQQVKTNSLAVAALVCGLGGLVIGISAPVGVGLGIAALVQIKRRGESGTGQAVAGIVVGALVTVLGGALLAIALIIGLNADDYQGEERTSRTSNRWRSGSASTTAGATTRSTGRTAPSRTTASSSRT